MDNTYVRLAGNLECDSIVNGPGLRIVVWMQGCPHKCEGCHNIHTHDVNKGKNVLIDDIYKFIDNHKEQEGITLSGGDPMMQIDNSLKIATYCKNKNLNVWCYTGYTFEQLISMSKKNNKIMDLLNNIDILVDGKFELNNLTRTSLYCGSTNQRIIDVKKTIKFNKIHFFNKNIKVEKEYNELVFI